MQFYVFEWSQWPITVYVATTWTPGCVPSLGTLCFNFHVIQVHPYCDALTYQEGQGILSLWMEYCLVPPKWINICRRVK